MTKTLTVINRLVEILVNDPSENICYAKMKVGLELGLNIDQINQHIENYRIGNYIK